MQRSTTKTAVIAGASVALVGLGALLWRRSVRCGGSKADSACSDKKAPESGAKPSSTYRLVVVSEQKPYLDELKKLPSNIVISGVGLKADDFGAGVLEKADIMLFCAGHNPVILREMWPLMKNLKWLHSFYAGVNHLMFPGLVESSVVMTNARSVFSHSLAEFCLLGMLHFAKRVPDLRRSQERGKWEPVLVEELRGQTLAVIGLGDIGRRCAQLARAVGMRTIGLRRSAPPAGSGSGSGASADPDVEAVFGLDQLHRVMASDFVVVATPLTDETRGLIDEKAIAAMKPTTVFINVGRGAVVDEKALIRALKDNKIRGAALDVFASEPLPDNHPMFGLPNVLLFPHCADRTARSHHESAEWFVKNAVEFAAGRALLSVVDKRAGY